jgi:hypothetical protein
MSISSDAGQTGASRLLPLSGVGFVILVIAAFGGLGQDTPGGGAATAKVRSFYDAHSTHQVAVAFVLAAAAPLLIFFGVSLLQAVWPADRGRRPFWPVVLAGGNLLAAGAFVLAAFLHLALADVGGQKVVSDGALQALNTLDADVWVAFNSCLGVMMLGAAGCLIPRAGALRILGWIALAAGIAFYIPFADFGALVVTALWIIVTSIMLFRGQREPALAAAPGLA